MGKRGPKPGTVKYKRHERPSRVHHTRDEEKKVVAKPTWWTDRMYVTLYNLAKQGHTDNQLCKYLRVHPEIWKDVLRKNPVLVEVLEDARRDRKEDDLVALTLERLPTRLRNYWEMAKKAAEEGKECPLKDRELDRRCRQRLFLEALVHCNFNANAACRMVGVNPLTYRIRWMREAKFAALMEALQEAKKDYFESALINLVSKGDAAAIIFVNRTLNRDRGYNDKIQVDVKKEVTHKVVLDDLPLDLRVKLLEALEDKEKEQQLGYDPGLVVEGTASVVEEQ